MRQAIIYAVASYFLCMGHEPMKKCAMKIIEMTGTLLCLCMHACMGISVMHEHAPLNLQWPVLKNGGNDFESTVVGLLIPCI